MHAYVSNQQKLADGVGLLHPRDTKPVRRGRRKGRMEGQPVLSRGDRFARDAAWSVRSVTHGIGETFVIKTG